MAEASEATRSPVQVEEVYREVGSIAETSVRTGYSTSEVQRILVDRNVPRASRGRPRVDWRERKKVALECDTWDQYRKRLGKSPTYQIGFDTRHGVRLRCYDDKTNPSVTIRYAGPNLGNVHVCQEDFDSWVAEGRPATPKRRRG